MTLKLVGARGFASARSFRLVGARGRASQAKAFQLVGARGRAVDVVAPSSTRFKLVGARGYAQLDQAAVDWNAAPYETVTLPVGVWTQVAGPRAPLGTGGMFIAPALLDGTVIRFQSTAGAQFTVLVAPHTVFRMYDGVLHPVFVSNVPAALPTVTVVPPDPNPPDPEPTPDPPVDPIPDPTDDLHLPFNMPTTETMMGSNTMIVAHPMGGSWVTPQQTINADGTDYTERNYFYYEPDGASLSNLYGGDWRDRYAKRPTRPQASGIWQVLDIEWEIRAAQAAGIEAFTWGTASRTGTEWTRLQYALKAAVNHNARNPTRKFYIIPWILSISSITGTATETPTESGQILADLITGLINNPTYAAGFYKRNGRTVIMPYAANRAPHGTGSSATPAPGVVTPGMVEYQAFDARLTANGTPGELWFEMSSNWQGFTDGFESVASAYGHFGSRDPAVSGSESTSYRQSKNWLQTTKGYTVRNAGATPMPYIAPISNQMQAARGNPEDPTTPGYIWEALGTLNLVNTCVSGIDQLTTGLNIWNINTWNDITEASHFMPSVRNGFHWLDLFSYYAVRAVTGAYPTILREGLYLTHRPQKISGVTYTSIQDKFVTVMSTTPLTDILDCTVYLTSAATVELVSGGNAPVTFSLSAGRYRVTAPLANGTQIARIKRGATVVKSLTSPQVVSATQLVQDLTYYGCSSFDDVARPVPVVPD